MEPTGVALGVVGTVKLVVDCYNRCKSVSADFNNLHDDLGSLQATLLLAEHDVTEEESLAIEKVVEDINRQLLKPRPRLLRPFSGHEKDIDKLRSRLTAQVVMRNSRLLYKALR